MNIFTLHEDPILAARMHCDRHVLKMVVELYQQLGSAVIRHGATPDMMPLTKAGTPLKGGYHNHPATKWVGDSRQNFRWAASHALELSWEYRRRFGKDHFCTPGIEKLVGMAYLIEYDDKMTDFALCMPDIYRPYIWGSPGLNEAKATHASGKQAVKAYREYYIWDKGYFAEWERGRPAPDWWVAI